MLDFCFTRKKSFECQPGMYSLINLVTEDWSLY